MKNLLILPLLFLLSLPATAQWVTIPDDNFANKLNELFPECMDGNQMDTECAAILTIDSLNISNTVFDLELGALTDITGIQYFVNLEVLDCSGHQLTFLPELPSSLIKLYCHSNIITELPELPESLLVLHCYFNLITELPALPNSLTELICHHNNLTQLPTLPVSLNYLHCQNNNLTQLPELPELLTVLSCPGNEIFELPVLPNSLATLECGDNSLNTLPNLPTSLVVLKCADNNLTELPELPNSLAELNCRENSLIELPELPNSLIQLLLDENNLSELPELPSALDIIWCTENNLSELPDLPGSLTELHCDENNLSELPELPNQLTFLSCSENLLSTLPELPESLVFLLCSNNQLIALPQLPGTLENLQCAFNNLINLPILPPELDKLMCNNNQITCLPTLPNSIMGWNSFNISNNDFTCLPNYIDIMQSGGDNTIWLSYPICDLSNLDNNPYGCNSLKGISGATFSDENTDCEFNEGENGLVNAQLQLLSEGDLIATTSGFSNSFYNFLVDTGTYTIKLVTENMPFTMSCDEPGDAQDVLLTADEPSAINVSFGLECPSGDNLSVQSVTPLGWVFPGQNHFLKISAGDYSSWFGLQCAADISGSVTVNISGPVSYVEPAENALVPDVSGDIQLTYNIDDFGEFNFENSFGIILETDTTAQEGEFVCVEVIVEPIEGDANPENNIYTYCYEVVNSYDPNIKQVWPHNVEPGFDGYFNYTIYFQNTGTAPAFNIRVADTLDTNLDLSTFEVTGYSHDCLTYVSDNVATFRFNNIMLPDSTSDFDGSIGYVQYRIKPIADLPVGTVIENTAHIYFDFNEAIVTNTTENEYVITTSMANQPMKNVKVYPNPGTGFFSISIDQANSPTLLEVYNLHGEKLRTETLVKQRHELDLSELPSGMYILRVQNTLGSKAIKLIKQ